MKKILISLLVFIFTFTAFAEGTVWLYAPDGIRCEVAEEEVEEFLQKGYGREKSDVVTKLYAYDGRSINVFNAEVQNYLDVGWHHYEDAITYLYTDEGRCLKIYKGEEETYLRLGWKKYENATATLYATDGRTLTIFKCEKETYLALGWHTRKLPDPSKPIIAFSFDDGPHGTYTKSVIDTLVANDCTATFFVLGRLASAYPDVVKYAVANGMELGNHSYNHANLSLLSTYGVQSDISSAASSIETASGTYPSLLRPPYGSTGSALKNNAGAPLILWSVDTLDWKSRNAYSVYNHILTHVKDGDIVLMHDIYPSTAEAVKMVVPELVKRGFQIVSVSELAKAKGYNMTAGNTYSQFR